MADPEPGIALRALESLRLQRSLRLSWGTAAAAAVLVMACSLLNSSQPSPAPMQIPEKLAGLDSILPRKVLLLAMAPPRPDARRILAAHAQAIQKECP